ncbi:carbon-nitrogen hydrolase [Pseudomonas oryzihabitans]|nr:carbon-nitrogen hydrolase [Pseudomonas psychrotolerans]
MRDLSPTQDLHLALLQSDLAWHDPAANRAHFERQLAEVGAVDLIILPEMFTTGFSMDSATLAEPTDGPTSAWMRAQAQRSGAVVTGSLIVQDEHGRYRNRLLWATPDGELLHYDKRHLFRMAGEHQHYAPGTERRLVTLKGWQIRPLVCYDLRFPVWSRAQDDTDLLLYVANWPAPRRGHWNRLLPARAIENLCYVAAVNRIGSDGNGHPYAGDSQVLDFQGEPLVEAGAAAGIFQATLSASALAAYRQRFPAQRDADAFSLS